MSVIERALQNLKKAAGAASTPDRRPIAQVADSGVERRSDVTVHGSGSAPLAKLEFDLATLRDAGLYPLGNQRLADEYRIIKRPILRIARGEAEEAQKRPNLLMVASALPGDGKTFTTVNLSLSLASEKDWSVLLVDVDCKNPQLSRLLGVVEKPGLLDVLRSPSLQLESVVFATNIEGLNVLPLGTSGDDAVELLASERMAKLCDELASRDRKQVVICDSSPLMDTVESIVLSGQVGQVLLVVNAWKTPQQAVVDAIDKLDPKVPVGIVLNRADPGEALRYGYGAYPVKAAS